MNGRWREREKGKLTELKIYVPQITLIGADLNYEISAKISEISGKIRS
jgi:hypothetical protein